MARDDLDQVLVFQFSEGSTGERAVDAETVNQDGGGNELVGGHFLEQLVISGLVEDNGVVGLVLDLSLAPLLQNSLRWMFGR